jgi:hypothetical protein
MRISKVIFMVYFALILQGTCIAQNMRTLLSNPSLKITWLGADFTQVRIIGDIGTVSTLELIPLFDKINLLIITETDKFDFKKALRKSDVEYDLNQVSEINSGINAENILSYSTSVDTIRINEQLIAGLLEPYKSEKQDGIGLLFFMENLDKITETGTMWVTFFDRSTTEIILTERMQGEAGGIGFRNHWANAIYEVIQQIKRSKYKKWMIQ